MRRFAYLILVVAAMLLVAPPAHAAFDLPGIPDCKSPPVAEAPGGGIAGFFGADGSDATGSGWANGAPRYDHYGMAGLTFHNYDLGCGPDAGRDPGAVAGTVIANWALEVAKFGVAATGALLHAAYHPTYLAVFDPLIVNATRTLRTTVFDQWAPLTIIVIGALLLWGARRAELSNAVAVVAWALLVMVVASAVFAYPVKVGSFADDTIGRVLGAVNSGINGQGDADPADAATGSLSNAVLYQQWKMGTFGRANGATADKYARTIYTSQALTYAEAKVVAADPDGEGKALLDAKAEAWTAAADKINSEDPDAYQYLTGHRGETRIAAGLVALVATLCTVPFLFIAAFLMIGAFLIIRLAVVFFPLVATVGIAHRFRGAVVGMGTVVAAAVVNTIVFGVGAAVAILAARILLAPASAIPLWLALALMGVFSFILWVAMRPVRKLTAMASPSRMFGDAAGAVGATASNVKDGLVDMGKAAIASYAGTAAALDHHDDETKPDPDAPPPERSEGITVPSPPAAAPAPTADPPPTPELVGAADRAPLNGAPVAPLPLPPPTPPTQTDAEPEQTPQTETATPSALPVGHLALDPAGALDSETPETTLADNPVFVPGELPDDVHPEPLLLPVAEPEIDTTTGEQVYTVFRPDEDESW